MDDDALEALAARASALAEGNEQWLRTADQTVGFSENEPDRRPGFGFLRVTFRTRARGGFKTRRMQSNSTVPPPAFGRFAYDGGVAGVFQSRGHAWGEATRFRQGLTLVHFSAQPEPVLTQTTTHTPPHIP